MTPMMISKMMLKSSTNLKINHIVNIAYSDIRIENTTPIQEPVVIMEYKEISWGWGISGYSIDHKKKNVSIVFLILTNQTKKVKDLIIGNS